jgi:hypothetical protein
VESLGILITGKLRFKGSNAIDEFIENLNGHTVYVSTYPEYKALAYQLTDNVMITETSDMDVPKVPPRWRKLYGRDATNLYQWWHLDALMKKYKEQLLTHKYLLKIRTDCNLYDKITLDYFQEVTDGEFYCNSDHSFYATSKHFTQTLSDFYVKGTTEYFDKCNQYIPINYLNLIKQDRTPKTHHTPSEKYNRVRRARHWLNGVWGIVYPKDIYSTDPDELIQNITDRIRDGKLTIDYTKGYTTRKGRCVGIKYFQSEKYFALHIINNSIVKQYKLPTFGVH